MNDDVLEILRCYPQVYLACHVDHVRKRSNEYGLSSNDSSILAHLHVTRSMSANDLARHLRVRPSTLSAALKRLEDLRYIQRDETPQDRRKKYLLLTERGLRAMVATSVLDEGRVHELLDQLDPAARRRAVDGLAILASAAAQMKSYLRGSQ
jgi:DNA-binding MarR family transcriptional regulator